MAKRKIGGIIALIGYILSPLSWWNDVFVNIPISYAITCALLLFLPKEYFTALFILAYNGTNILGFILMHIGAEAVIKNDIKLTRGNVVKYVLVSVVYTFIVYLLAEIGYIKPIQEYIFP